ncbi:sulfite exporter TauE/SafE family protein [Hydrogenophaga sp. PAMC20947]|uniref:sulfite exporter TauE/SafE family protein n=1 Tax=Hydrogenophaga sp. PAMC20947 TaxID=2565558 RepID=UPI0014466B94|nr:sulfite exporter TauE/SafE family protein [Hydrogenophaga sp. PAMC20947]
MAFVSALTLDTLWVLLCIGLASYVQNLTGFAFGLIFLALVGVFDLLPIAEAANAVTLITLTQTLIYFREYPLTPEWRVVKPVIVPSLIGVLAGLGLLVWFSSSALYLLKIALGVAVVGSSALLVMRFKPKTQMDSPASFAVIGVFSGLMGGLFSTAGPPLVYKLYRQPLSLPVVRQALLVMFGINQLVRLIVVVGAGQLTLASLVLAVMALPLQFLVTRGNRQYPLNMSPVAISRLSAGLLFMAGCGLKMKELGRRNPHCRSA